VLHRGQGPARPGTALLALRDHVIALILAGIRSPRIGRKPKIWTAIDRDYENLRVGMQTLFRHVGIDTLTAAGDRLGKDDPGVVLVVGHVDGRDQLGT
jgi:hypothetical protein